jgi:fructokinase
MNKRFTVAGLGEILWDLLPEGKKLGGAPANFAYHAQELGAKSLVISAIGEDKLGKELSEKLKEHNLSTSYISIDSRHPTGTVEVKIGKDGVPDYVIHTKVAWDYISVSKEVLTMVQSLDAICFGSLAQRSPHSKQSIQDILKSTSDRCLRIFDINIRQSFYSRETIVNSLNLSNCLKLNESEFSLLTEMFSYQGSDSSIARTILKEFELDLIALTKGDKGSDLYTPSESSKIASPVVRIEDTVGAGDAFTASLCMGLLKNNSITEIHKNASDIAAYVCSQRGATPAIPNTFKI